MDVKSQKALLAMQERQLLLTGRIFAQHVASQSTIRSLREVEFKVFSQFGDDGIIQWLIANLEIPHKTFVEFGVENYRESNTRFLMMNDNWSGFVMDGSVENIEALRKAEYFWMHELIAKAAFIDCENINELLSEPPFDPEIGLLHIDLDGNDYWIWKAINCISPIVVILEYNSVFGKERAVTVPYDKSFNRTEKHFSNLYFGSSLPALHRLSKGKGYAFIGCNSAGNNAYFVRSDKLNESVTEISLEAGFVESKFRESRSQAGDLTYIAGRERIELIRGMPVYNVERNQLEEL